MSDMMQIDTSSVKVRPPNSRRAYKNTRNGFKRGYGRGNKGGFRKQMNKGLTTGWDGVVYKKIHVVKDMINVSSGNAGYKAAISWGVYGTTTANAIFCND